MTQEIKQLMYDASEIIINEVDCYKNKSDTYIEGMRVAKGLKAAINGKVSSSMPLEIESLHARIQELEEANKRLKIDIEHVGEIADVCTRPYTGNVCELCRCGKYEELTNDK